MWDSFDSLLYCHTDSFIVDGMVPAFYIVKVVYVCWEKL